MRFVPSEAKMRVKRERRRPVEQRTMGVMSEFDWSVMKMVGKFQVSLSAVGREEEKANEQKRTAAAQVGPTERRRIRRDERKMESQLSFR